MITLEPRGEEVTRLVQVTQGLTLHCSAGELVPGTKVRLSAEEAAQAMDAGAAVPAFDSAPDWGQVPAGDGFCSPATARCADSHDYTVERRACCRAIVHELLRFTTAMLESQGIVYWADYGTLLGAVRHGGMIPWDKDADLGILDQDLGVVIMMQAAARAAGLGWAVSRHGTVKFRASKLNTTNVDIFTWHGAKGGRLFRKEYAACDRFKGREFPASMLFPLTTVDYEGITLPAPRDPEAFLAYRYGSEWRTPIRANNDGKRR